MPKIKSLNLLINLFFLIGSVLLVFFWIQIPGTSFYTLQLVALFIIFYFLNQKVGKGSSSLLITIITFSIVVLLLVATTGGLGSPLFFLVYFLLFASALLLSPPITFVLTLTLIFFFLVLGPLNKLENIISLASLFFISPLAFLFGKQYLRLLAGEKKITILQRKGRQLDKAIKKEETSALIWLSLELKNGLLRIINQVSELLARPSSFSWQQKEKLEEILASAQRLLRTGETLKKEIDETTD